MGILNIPTWMRGCARRSSRRFGSKRATANLNPSLRAMIPDERNATVLCGRATSISCAYVFGANHRELVRPACDWHKLRAAQDALAGAEELGLEGLARWLRRRALLGR